MIKIFNWLFGACFRTLGRFLAIFIVGLLLVFIGSKIGFELPDWLVLNVNASENIYSDYWGDLNKQDGSTANRVIAGYYGNTLNTNDNYFFYNTTKTPSQINIISHYEFQFYTDFYNIVQNFNNNTNADGSIDIKNALSVYLLTTNANNVLQSTICKIKENTGAYYIAECPIVAGVKNIRGLRVDLKMNSLGSYLLPVISIGFAKDVLGYIDTNAQNNHIQQDTNNKLDDVNQSLQDTNQSIQDTNDNIMNSDSPNVSGMTDLAGYLPPGPLDSVLNLPLSILNSLNTKLSSSCTPLSLNLPFVNLPLNIPCLSTIFNQISGLNILFEFIGVIGGALIMYSYLTYLYNWVDDVTSLRHNKARLFGAKSDADNWGGA